MRNKIKFLVALALIFGVNYIINHYFLFEAGILLGAGVFVEIWVGEVIKKFRASEQATWLDGVPDYSQFVKNEIIHLVDVGADPEVLINNTTYPIGITDSTDVDVPISLDKFQTRATPVSDDILYAISYDKIALTKDQHAQTIMEKKFDKAIHAFAPASNTAKTPVLKTTGNADETGRKRLTRADVIALKKKFDKMKVPLNGRRLVLCADHVADLLLTDQTFADQYYNYATGKIANMYGFEVYEYVNCPWYDVTTGQKLAFGSQPGNNHTQASVAFFAPRMFKAEGSTQMYYDLPDTQHQRALINFRHYWVALPKTQEAIGAIYSDLS